MPKHLLSIETYKIYDKRISLDPQNPQSGFLKSKRISNEHFSFTVMGSTNTTARRQRHIHRLFTAISLRIGSDE